VKVVGPNPIQGTSFLYIFNPAFQIIYDKMPEEYVYSKPEEILKPKKSHMKFVITLAIVLVSCVAAYYLLGIGRESSLKTDALASIDKLIKSVENTNSAYNEEQISYALENPGSFSSSELLNYTQASSINSLAYSLNAIKGILQKQPKISDTDNASVTSYIMIMISSEAMSFTAGNGLIYYCRNQENLTEVDKKACIMDVLNAQKSALSYYYGLDYDGNVERCTKLLESDKAEFNELVAFNLKTICENMISYRKQLFEEVKVSKIDYNQKYSILTSLRFQEMYLGNASIPSDEVTRVLKEGMKDNKYVNLIR
jgi:hypothetical protein